VILLDTEALVVRTVEFGESDIIATLITEQAGKVSTAVRGARKSSRRTGGALEPLHTIAVRIEDRGKELTTLKEARVVRVRAGLASNLDALEAAGVALRWARHLFPPRTVEPEGWRVLIELLDVLDATAAAPATAPTSALSSRRELAKAGLAMLTAVGYGLDFDRCVACGRECPPGKAACIDPARGGLICRTCGGAPTVLLPEARDVARAFARGAAADVSPKDAESLLGLVTRAMAAHTGFDR
jgi:DNA repair protein RecO (recombination protein O)